MSEVIGAAAIIGFLVGIAIAAIALIVMIGSLSHPAGRARALGFVYVGLSSVAASGALFGIAHLGGTLPVVAGLPPIAIALITSFALRLAASREFRRSRDDHGG